MIHDSICLAIAIGSVIFTAWYCGVYVGTVMAIYCRRHEDVDQKDNLTAQIDEQ
jgi:hypothetical protein